MNYTDTLDSARTISALSTILAPAGLHAIIFPGMRFALTLPEPDGSFVAPSESVALPAADIARAFLATVRRPAKRLRKAARRLISNPSLA